jgi:hypothetical protein
VGAGPHDKLKMTIRTTEIRPPSVRAETLNVVKAAAAIVVLVAAYLFRPAFAGGADDRAAGRPSDLLPFQALVRDAPSADQRTFRELQEGLLEAERLRATTGRWPEAAALAAQGIPPFAADPTRKDVSYRWSTLQQGVTVNYVGIPSTPSADAWLLVILEPEAGAPPDPAPRDETHHRLPGLPGSPGLPDGATLHVSVWNIPEKSRTSGFTALPTPQNEGWTQLLIGRQ